MGRHLKKPDFDHDVVMREMLDIVVKAYEKIERDKNKEFPHGSLKYLSDELGLKPTKVRKLLITAGERNNEEIYKSDKCRRILKMYRNGKTVEEIMSATGLSRSSVFGYLPYRKGIYKASELSTDAERVRLFRNRQDRCHGFTESVIGKNGDEIDRYLWETLEYIQGCIFYTTAMEKDCSVGYRYKVIGGEIVMDRKNIAITKKDVLEAFSNVWELYKENRKMSANDLKINGREYLYPIFKRLGICSSEPSGESPT